MLDDLRIVIHTNIRDIKNFTFLVSAYIFLFNDSNGADVLCALAGPISFKLVRVGYSIDHFSLLHFSTKASKIVNKGITHLIFNCLIKFSKCFTEETNLPNFVMLRLLLLSCIHFFTCAFWRTKVTLKIFHLECSSDFTSPRFSCPWFF